MSESARELFPQWRNKIFAPELTAIFVHYWLHFRADARDRAGGD